MKRLVFVLLGILVLTAAALSLPINAQGGSVCDHDPNCEKVDNPGNSGSYSAPQNISVFVIKAGTSEFAFMPPGGDNGCYSVSISGNNVNWNRYGDGPNCKDISHIQLWLDPGTPEPTSVPTSVPTTVPTSVPTTVPTSVPTTVPTGEPTAIPTSVPTTDQTGEPTAIPTSVPTTDPTGEPTSVSTLQPTTEPTVQPTIVVTVAPTDMPIQPTTVPDQPTDPGQPESVQPQPLIPAVAEERPCPLCAPARCESTEATFAYFDAGLMEMRWMAITKSLPDTDGQTITNGEWNIIVRATSPVEGLPIDGVACSTCIIEWGMTLNDRVFFGFGSTIWDTAVAIAYHNGRDWPNLADIQAATRIRSAWWQSGTPFDFYAIR